MISLKAALPDLAKIFGTSEIALYERQRVLVRLGVLEPTPGRGPGSGVKLTPYSASALLIAFAAYDSLSAIDASIFRYLNAELDPDGYLETTDSIDESIAAVRRGKIQSVDACPLTGARDFISALLAMIAKPRLREKLRMIAIEVNTRRLTIEYHHENSRLKNVVGSTDFLHSPEQPKDPAGITRTVWIWPEVLERMALVVNRNS